MAGSTLYQLRPSASQKNPRLQMWSRRELHLLLALYGRMVLANHWRDYALDADEAVARFAVFRHAWDRPFYMIEKHFQARKGAPYLLQSASGQCLARHTELPLLLRYFERRRFAVVR